MERTNEVSGMKNKSVGHLISGSVTNDRKYFIIAGIPAYNEEKYIAKVILKTKRYVDEVIVVNDGSTDMTAEIARALGATVIEHPKNMGYGATLRTIFLETKKRNPDVLVILDADDQHDPNEIPKLIEPILKGKADIVIGSRFLGKTQQPLWRRIGVKVITWLTKKTHKLPKHITDAQSGYRAYSKKAIQLITPEDNDMGASIDILYQAMKHNLRIVEVPITVRYHKEASTQNPLLHASRVVTRIIGIVIEKHPLLYLGLPGTILTLIGIVAATYVVWVFNQTRYFSIPITLMAIAFTFIGLLLTITALILYAISDIRRRLRA